jgi:hypothetical protein
VEHEKVLILNCGPPFDIFEFETPEWKGRLSFTFFSPSSVFGRRVVLPLQKKMPRESVEVIGRSKVQLIGLPQREKKLVT